MLNANLENKMVIDALWDDHPGLRLAGEETEEEMQKIDTEYIEAEIIQDDESTDLITIQQLPVIVEQLHKIKAAVSEKVANALAMPCTKETVMEIKKVRADLNKDFKDLEARRKYVKAAILKPYEAFEAIYRECASELFTTADNQLRDAIGNVEDGIKNEKRKEIEAFYLDALAARGLDFPTFDQSGIKIGISDSIASLKKQASEIAAKTADDVAMIAGHPYADEIMVEYRNSLNASRSVTTVTERHKAIEAQRARMESSPAVEPMPIQPVVPRVIVPLKTDDEVTVKFCIVGSQRKIDALTKFLEDGWYKYEMEA